MRRYTKNSSAMTLKSMILLHAAAISSEVAITEIKLQVYQKMRKFRTVY